VTSRATGPAYAPTNVTSKEQLRDDALVPQVEDAESSPDYTSAIYGSLLVTTLVAVQWRSDALPELIAITLITSVVVFWLTHAWAGIVNRRVRGPLAKGEGFHIARDEAPMLTAAVIPALALILPRIAGVDVNVAIGLALIASIVQLFVWGLVVGRAAHERWLYALGVALVDCLLGIAIVGAKVLVLH
jgi:hypothetical protein